MKIALLSLALPIAQPTFVHQVIEVAEGDTLKVLKDRRSVRNRLANIDASEKSQDFGNRSQTPAEMCYPKDTTYEDADVGQYGRTVAVVYCDGVNVNQAQVQNNSP